MTNVPKREASATVLETDNNEVASISLSLRLVRVTRESEEHDVSRLYFLISR